LFHFYSPGFFSLSLPLACFCTQLWCHPVFTNILSEIRGIVTKMRTLNKLQCFGHIINWAPVFVNWIKSFLKTQILQKKNWHIQGDKWHNLGLTHVNPRQYTLQNNFHKLKHDEK
jgi:hypothetical protein